jgi:hypothetical protein
MNEQQLKEIEEHIRDFHHAAYAAELLAEVRRLRVFEERDKRARAAIEAYRDFKIIDRELYAVLDEEPK